MSARVARCSCGMLTVTVEGEPLRISICHCHDCQRRTGSVFGVQAWFPKESVAVSGASSEYCRVADSGNRITFHFCPSCGATVYYEPEVRPGMVGIPVGAFADSGFPPPRVSVYEARKHPWVRLPEAMEHID